MPQTVDPVMEVLSPAERRKLDTGDDALFYAEPQPPRWPAGAPQDGNA